MKIDKYKPGIQGFFRKFNEGLAYEQVIEIANLSDSIHQINNVNIKKSLIP